MPQLFRIGSWWVFFWVNEGDPVEPIHVHVAQGRPAKDATKVWITKAGKCLIANNNSRIPKHALRNICRIVESRSEDVVRMWKDQFGDVTYYC